MGALLSIPLLAVPSIGTVSAFLLTAPSLLTHIVVDDVRRIMLWGGNMLRGMQHVWEMSGQVRLFSGSLFSITILMV